MTDTVFDISQESAAMRLGVPTDWVRAQVNTLTEAVDFQRRQKRVLMSAAALEKLAGRLGVSEGAAPEKKPAPVLLSVFRGARDGILNVRIVEAVDAQERRVRVRVRHHQHYVRGMELTCKQLGEDLYEHWDFSLDRPHPEPRSRGPL